jgi:hypothetical protein
MAAMQPLPSLLTRIAAVAIAATALAFATGAEIR